MSVTINYPEMWGNVQDDIQAECTCLPNKPFRVVSRKELVLKRGMEYTGVVGPIGANNMPNARKGWHKYYMTQKAYDNFVKENNVVLNCLLD